MITKDNLQELINDIIEITTNQIIPKLSPNEDIVPCIFVSDSAREIIGIAQIDLPDNPDHRFHIDRVLRHKLHDMKAASYAFTMMGWMTELDREDPIAQMETFMVTAGSPIAFTTKIFKVIRDKTQKITSLEDYNIPSNVEQYGLFIDMLGSRSETNTLH